jgi:hypothetical protein
MFYRSNYASFLARKGTDSIELPRPICLLPLPPKGRAWLFQLNSMTSIRLAARDSQRYRSKGVQWPGIEYTQ